MENKVCCGFGHREVLKSISALPYVLEDLILNENITVFMTGGMGEFDKEFTSAIRKLQNKYSYIKLLLVKPYLSQELNKNKKYYETMFNSIIIPDALIGVHYKAAITKRNRWMVDNSDIVISYVYRNFGGAYDATRYAAKLNKKIINLY